MTSKSATSAQIQPIWVRRGDRLNAMYNVPDRVNTIELYPVRASNGSSIVIYGHDNGITCLWQDTLQLGDVGARLGNPLDSVHSAGDRTVLTSNVENSPSLPASSSRDNSADKLDGPEHIQQYRTSADIRHINLNTAVLDVTSSPAPEDFSNSTGLSIPRILHERLIVAVACADGSVRLINTPMSPPELIRPFRGKKRSGEDEFTSLLVTAESSPAPGLIRGVSMTWTSTTVGSKMRPGQSENPRGSNKWRLLIAYSVASGLGQLRIVEFSLNEAGTEFLSPSRLIKVEHLANPIRSLSFNPSVFPSERHSQLLMADISGVLRIYDPLSSREETSDSASARSPGNWLVSLRPSFGHENTGIKHTRPTIGRLAILDAQWGFSGKCIVILMEDGQWGVWDIGGFDSNVTSNRGSNSTAQILSGYDLTRFALRGHVGSDQQRDLLEESKRAQRQSENVKLVPMTPKSRKEKQVSLFTGSFQITPQTPRRSVGGISLRSSCSNPSDTQDESLIIWHNSKILAIPSLSAYWSAVASDAKESMRTSAHQDQKTSFSLLARDFMGHSSSDEIIIGVSQPRNPLNSPVLLHAALSDGIVLCTEHLLTISYLSRTHGSARSLASVFNEPEASIGRQDARPMGQRSSIPSELDLHSMNAMLDGMSGSL